jgi:hypothetical protein
MPFMGTLMMRGGYFDEDGTVHTTGLPGEMLVSMVFSDSNETNDDDEEDLDSKDRDVKKTDGPADLTRTGQWFNKRERFKDVFWGRTMWDMVTNFGFQTLPDGRIMAYHHGEYFKGNIPPISLLVRLVFGIHARWVAWATEHHLNHFAFQDTTEFDESMEHYSRVDMPLFLLKNYAWSDLMAVLFGRKVEKPSFLVQKSAEEATKQQVTKEDKEEQVPLMVGITESTVPSPEHKLPFQKPAILRRITMDIHIDRRNSKITLGEKGDSADRGLEQINAEHSLPQKKAVESSVRRISTEVALKRYETSLNRALTKTKSQLKVDEPADSPIQRQETLGTEVRGGNAVWEAMRSTNNPEAYKAASIAARSRFSQRRATSRRQSFEDSRTKKPISDSNMKNSDKARIREDGS